MLKITDHNNFTQNERTFLLIQLLYYVLCTSILTAILL